MKVKVIKCSYSNYWYNDLIGEVFDNVEEISDDPCFQYRVPGEFGGMSYFAGDDVTVVNDLSTHPNKYSREIKPGVFVDVYDVLRAFNVTDPCLQHLLKKALAGGQRGHKDLHEDLKDILASAKRALEMYEEWEVKK